MPSTGKKLKGGKIVGKVGAKAGRKLSPHAGKAALKLGKAEMKLVRAALRGREPRSSRYLKYGAFLAVGIVLGALVRSAKKPDASGHGGPTDQGGPRAHSRPDEGPLAGRGGGGFVSSTVVPEEQEDVEQRIRSAIGQDHRTEGIPRPNVTVNDGIAELRGPVPTEAVKSAVAEIAAGVEGVREVRNLLVVT